MPARALFAATLASATARRPVVLAVPTGVEAERLAADLREFLGADAGRAVPGVGDAAVRAGVARGRDDGPPPARDLAAARRAATTSLRSWSRRCARSCSGSGRTSRRSSRSSCSPATQLDRDGLVERLVPMGYRREYQVEARGEARGARRDRRRLPVDRRPSRADRPLGRRGRPPVAVLGRRPALDGQVSTTRGSSRSASCCRPRRCASARRRAAEDAAVGLRAVGAPRGGPDLRRHGVVAAVAVAPTSTCCPTSCPRARSSRCSSRAGCATARRSCSTKRPRSRDDAREDVGRDARSRDRRRASRCRSSGCSRTRRRRRCRCSTRPTIPTRPRSPRPRSDPVVGDTDALGAPAHAAAHRRVTACSSRPRAADRPTASSSCSSARV